MAVDQPANTMTVDPREIEADAAGPSADKGKGRELSAPPEYALEPVGPSAVVPLPVMGTPAVVGSAFTKDGEMINDPRVSPRPFHLFFAS
jgi:hypothetical protein